MANQASSDMRLSLCVWAAIASVVAIYFFWISHYSLQAPESEDIATVYKPLTIFFDSGTLEDKYQALTKEHGEHRLLFSRLSALFSIYVLDYLNVPFLYFLGASIVLLIVLLIYRDQVASSGSAPVTLLIFLLLLLNPAYRTASFAAWGLSNFASVLLPMLAILVIRRHSWPAFIVFQCLGYLSINTQGNGSLVPLFGLAYYACNLKSHGWIKLFLHVLSSFVFFYVSFRSYENQGYLVMAYGYFIEHPLDVTLFFMSAFVSWFGQWVIVQDSIMHGYTKGGLAIAATVGSGILISSFIFVIKNIRQLTQQYPVRFYFLLYIFLTILGAAWQRSWLWAGYHQSTDISHLWFVLDIRYRFYPLCFLLVILSLYFSTGATTVTARKVWSGLVIASLLFWFCSYYYAKPYMDKDAKKWSACIDKWQHHEQAKPCQWHTDNRDTIKEAIRQGWMRIGNTEASR